MGKGKGRGGGEKGRGEGKGEGKGGEGGGGVGPLMQISGSAPDNEVTDVAQHVSVLTAETCIQCVPQL